MTEHSGDQPDLSKSLTLFISNMDCVNEERLIRDHLGKLAGVGKLTFELGQQRLFVTHTLESDEAIMASLKAIGMKPVRVKAPAP